MSRAPSEIITLHVTSTGQGSKLKNHYQWPAEIRLEPINTWPNFPPFLIRDPFDRIDNDRVSNYLDTALDRDEKFDEEDGAIISRSIDEYRKNLFACLGLNGILRKLVGRKVEVRIHESEDSCTGGARSIYSLHWEHLEDLSLWSVKSYLRKTGPLSVTVRRDVNTDIRSISRSTSQALDNGATETFNILLVVARKHLYDRSDIDYFNPTNVQGALLDLQEQLQSRDSGQRIHIEVVRPGSLEELTEHLKRRRNMGRDHGFQVVHLDMHGFVSPNNGPFLHFNKYDDDGHRLSSEDVKAETVAKLLKESGINCAVLSACKSAKADAKGHANLSRSFIETGISTVLAMSHNMPDTLSEIFFIRFYYELFISRQEFAVAATKARTSLRKNPKRWSYKEKAWISLQDWFVPVVYSNGNRWYIDRHQDIHNDTRHRRLHILAFIIFPIFIINLIAIVSRRLEIPFDWPVLNPTFKPLARFLVRTDVILVTSLYVSRVCFALVLRPYYRMWLLSCSLKTLSQDRKNILRIEGDLMRSEKIFIDTWIDVGQTAQKLLDAMTDIWRRTYLVEHRVFIKAEWFIRPYDWRSRMVNVINLIRWGSIFAGERQLVSPLRNNGARTVVVIDNVDTLFPQTLLQQNYHLEAQKRFVRWLDEHFSGDDGTTPNGTRTCETTKCYLVLVVQGLPENTARRWLKTHLGHSRALQSAAITEYTHPVKFDHNPE